MCITCICLYVYAYTRCSWKMLLVSWVSMVEGKGKADPYIRETYKGNSYIYKGNLDIWEGHLEKFSIFKGILHQTCDGCGFHHRYTGRTLGETVLWTEATKEDELVGILSVYDLSDKPRQTSLNHVWGETETGYSRQKRVKLGAPTPRKLDKHWGGGAILGLPYV